MRMSIGMKLGLGFGVVIALMAASSTIVHVCLRSMNETLAVVLDDATATVRACDRLQGSASQSIAALRGYIILGNDPKDAEIFKSDRKEAWDEIDSALSELQKFAGNWQGDEDKRSVAGVQKIAQELRDAQADVEGIAHTEQNVKASYVLTNDAVPRANEIVKNLSDILSEKSDVDASSERRQLREAVGDSQLTFALCLASIRGFLHAQQEEFKTTFNEEWQKNQSAFDIVTSHIDNFSEKERTHWNRYATVRAEFSSLPQKIFNLRQAEDWNQAEYRMETGSAPLARRLKETLDVISVRANERLSTSRAELDAASGTVSMALLLATLMGTLIGGATAFVLSRKIVGTVRALAARANEISQGNLCSDALLIKSGDELGQLADGFDTMLVNLKDLTGQILSVTQNVNSAAAQISCSAKQQACSTKEQAATVQQITSTMQEIAQSGSQIVEKAKEVATAAESAAQQSKSGIAAVQNTTQTMESIREQVEEVAENIVALSEKTQVVGDIIATVNDIAEQSNLLALNATIEAADAGEEGNRFSVVANEMKNLADQAKTCTIQVRNILGEIQKGINSAVMLTEEAVKRVEIGKQQADISQDVIRRMSETTDESVQAFQQIIGATSQQQVGFEQVTKGMQNIDQATQQTASGTAQLEQAVLSLSAMSGQLKSAVSYYQLQA